MAKAPRAKKSGQAVKRKRRKSTCAPFSRDVEAALQVLCGKSPSRMAAYAKSVQKKATEDGGLYATFIKEHGGPNGQGEHEECGDFQDCLRRTLASMFLTSVRGDAAYSLELGQLALRFALDPCEPVTGDSGRFKCQRVSSGWVIDEYPSRQATLLPKAPALNARTYTTAFSVLLLDCVLPPKRDLGTLQNLIVRFLGSEPTGRDALPGYGEQTPEGELGVIVDRQIEVVRFCNLELKLEPLLVALFAKLCEGKGEIVADGTLYSLWQDSPPDLKPRISRIRKAFKKTAALVKDRGLRKQATTYAKEILPPKKRGIGYRVMRPQLIKIV